MTGLKARELRDLSDGQLQDCLLERREALYRLRADIVFRRATNTSAQKTLKKDIARLLTILGERDLPETRPGVARVKSSAKKPSRPTHSPKGKAHPESRSKIVAANVATEPSLEDMGPLPRGEHASDRLEGDSPGLQRPQSVRTWFDSLESDSMLALVPCEFNVQVSPYDPKVSGGLMYVGPEPVFAIAAIYSDHFSFDNGCMMFTIPVREASEILRFRCVPLGPGDAEIDLLITEKSTGKLLSHLTAKIIIGARPYAKV